MSDEGEKTCPLCAEEMDLTDQQLKPCKCGYEICVWCWHHIMDMAEKDETEGRCPACRTPYNKEKIVGMTANCGRLVSEMNMEKNLKSQKGKSKMSEGRKQLSTVRVVQRNLVYVVGLPLNLADEELLLRKEYFGQYGKVLKVSISRTAAGAIQHFANSTCSVYITYSKEEEAVRCIQSVHGFILEGRSLRACFGTTKYCHAWLRNVPCSNPDCLYLHEIGSQEDSFTKDEIISAYTRSRVQQISGATNSAQRHSGNVLPPPADEDCNNSTASSGKPLSKPVTCTNNSGSSVGVSPPNSSSGRSAALPAGASWGTRISSNQPLSTSITCTNGPLKQKPDVCNGPVTFPTAVTSPGQASSLHSDNGNKLIPSEESNTNQEKGILETVEPVKKESTADCKNAVSQSSSTSVHPASSQITRQLVEDGNVENICSEILSMSIDKPQQYQNSYAKHIRETLASQASRKSSFSTDKVYASNSTSEKKMEKPFEALQVDSREMVDNLLSYDNQRHEDHEFATSRRRLSEFPHSFHFLKHSNSHSPVHNNADGSVSANVDRQFVDTKGNFIVSASSIPVVSNGHPKKELNISSELVNDVEHIYKFQNSKDKSSLLGRFEDEVAIDGRPVAVDMGESSIISNILSIDSYSWDESLTSPQNVAKLLGETDRRQGSFGVPSSRKIQNSNQSRFSFAREEESMIQASDFRSSINCAEQAFKQHPFGHDYTNSNGFHLEKFGTHNKLSVFNGVEVDNYASHHIYSDKLPGSKSQISAPPGFSVPSRAPPPGFTFYERTEQTFDPLSGNHMPDASSVPRNQYQALPSGNGISSEEIEFMDPAILAVGKGMLPGSLSSPSLDTRLSFPPHLSAFDELRFQSMLQRSVPPLQNQRFTNFGDTFSPLGDAYGIPSRVVDQTLANNLSPFSHFTHPQARNEVTSNGQWEGWNEVHGGNNLAMAELLRNERLGYNKSYGGYEDSKIRMPNSGNLYNGAFGI